MTRLAKFAELLQVYSGTTAYSVGGGYVEDSRVESDMVTRVSVSDEDVPTGSFIAGTTDETLLDYVPYLSSYTTLTALQLQTELDRYVRIKSSYGRNPKSSFLVLTVLNNIVCDMETEPAIIEAFGWE